MITFKFIIYVVSAGILYNTQVKIKENQGFTQLISVNWPSLKPQDKYFA